MNWKERPEIALTLRTWNPYEPDWIWDQTVWEGIQEQTVSLSRWSIAGRGLRDR